MCIVKAGALGDALEPEGISNKDKAPLSRLSLRSFDAYLKVCRVIQTKYSLEPAGSRGVWGLDDYHCLGFYVGSCQMVGLERRRSRDDPKLDVPEDLMSPGIVRDERRVREEKGNYVYLDCVGYVRDLKRCGSFQETSPMLYDVSHVEGWDKVRNGMFKVWVNEVVGKFVVAQHFGFGKLWKADWVGL